MRKLPAKMFLVITVAFGIVGYSFMEAAWTAPSANPPASNVAEPINEGSSSQTKTGALNVGSLGSGPILIDGDIRLDNPSPAVMLNDSDAGEKAFWLQANSNSLYVLADRANGISAPSYLGHDPWPLQIFTGATTSDDYALFSNRIRATSYCNRVGGECFTPADVVAPTAPMSTSTFLNTSATAQSKSGSLTLSGTSIMTASRLTATTQVRSPQYCDSAGGNCFAASTVLTETEGLAQSARYVGTNRVTGLTPGKKILIFANGGNDGTAGLSVEDCNGNMLFNTPWVFTTDRGTTESHFVPVTPTTSQICVFTDGGGKRAATYVTVIE